MWPVIRFMTASRDLPSSSVTRRASGDHWAPWGLSDFVLIGQGVRMSRAAPPPTDRSQRCTPAGYIRVVDGPACAE